MWISRGCAVVLCLASALVLRPASASAQTAPCAAPASVAVATVAGVLDGDTLQLADGGTLRLAGILAPRASDVHAAPSAWPAALAAKAELEALVLAKDVSIHAAMQGARDRYGRLLGQVYVRAAAGEAKDLAVQDLWVQGHLLRQGLVRAVTTARDRSCAAALLAIEQAAREAARGLWQTQAYAPHTGRALDGLAPLAGSFQILEGEVARVRRLGRRLHLHLRSPGRRAPVVVMDAAGPRAVFPDAALQPRPGNLAGARVRVRGWLEDSRGMPALDISLAGDLEVLARPRTRE